MKTTRDELFKKSFDIIIQDFCEIRHMNTYEWSLKRTSRKPGSLHKYKFLIPRSYLQYTMSQYTDHEGAVHPVEEVYTYQFPPEPTAFVLNMNAYFANHYVKTGDDVVSYVRMEHKPNPESQDFVATIEIKYINGFLPYPIPPTDLEIANQRIVRLSTELINLKVNAEIGLAIYTEYVEARGLAQQNEIRNNIIQLKSKTKMLHRMKDKLKEQYKINNPDDCPICYIPIPYENLVITDCCHYLCSNCSEKCARCPLCRSDL